MPTSHTRNHRNNPISCFCVCLLILYLIYTSNHFLNTSFKCSSSSRVSDVISTTETIQTDHKVRNVSITTIANATTNLITPKNLVIPYAMRHEHTQLKHIAFGVAASSLLWENRKEYIKQWWRPGETRGVVWLDKNVVVKRNERLPEIRISADTSEFAYSNRQGDRSAIRISRVVSETLRLGMKDIRWFVMGDDDTVFMVENVVRVLSKYDHTQHYYIGCSSESHVQNMVFSYAMAFGGGGFAISYPLAVELEKMQDRCIQRYPGLYGSDDRMQACMAELGVPLTKEYGFHQYDVYGSLLGLLGAHPLTPIVSLHHLDVLDPIYPKMTRARAIRHLLEAAKYDSASIIQQSICYDSERQWSIIVSWGYVVQVIRGILSPRELEMPTRTFLNWYKRADYTAYAFNTRPVSRQPCQKPFIFYMNTIRYDEKRKQIVSIHSRHDERYPLCKWKMDSPDQIESIVVMKRPDNDRWQKSPRRDCCRVLPSSKNSSMNLWVGKCGAGEIIGI
ncbi:Transferring glycosyl group transferase [Heracleum sosnowskyi]|uniref:Transferring glycosyl group transferase n=1 Tax=Heracleum sosnowskyi TaxID=360622 RepID=A0AAD8MI43_9APIA|nr:Transferring glycosyl group transferase [Heracleum sosnowskyi]